MAIATCQGEKSLVSIEILTTKSEVARSNNPCFNPSNDIRQQDHAGPHLSGAGLRRVRGEIWTLGGGRCTRRGAALGRARALRLRLRDGWSRWLGRPALQPAPEVRCLHRPPRGEV